MQLPDEYSTFEPENASIEQPSESVEAIDQELAVSDTDSLPELADELPLGEEENGDEDHSLAERRPSQPFVIGIGASAGGLEALTDFLANLPSDLENVVFIIAQHLSPTHKSMLVQLLGRQTKLEVVEARNGGRLTPNVVYITPPDTEITIVANEFRLRKPTTAAGPKPSVDVLLRSLAFNSKEYSIGIILSGTGSDGADGIRAVKAVGGFTIAQEPHTAKYDGMPVSAIQTGDVDIVLSPEKMGEEIKEFLQSFMEGGYFPRKHMLLKRQDSLEEIIEMLSEYSGTDFTHYKPSTICRRLEKRISTLGMKDVDSYVNHVKKDNSELEHLFNTVLIGVTSFFRDPESFVELEKYVEKIIEAKSPGDSIRIWCPGCASGEEAYSMAIVVCKILKTRLRQYNVQIFATDIDEQAISVARRGLYTQTVLESVPPEILREYFTRVGEHQFEVSKTLRSLVLFSRHDLTNNPPFLKLDLISCRNLLIYFSAALQHHVIPIFHYALNNGGFLYLGKSETVGQFSNLFVTIDGKHKIFRRKIGNYLHAIKFSAFRNIKRKDNQTYMEDRRTDLSLSDMMKETLFNSLEFPIVVVNDIMDVKHIFGNISKFLTLPIGEMNANILKMAHKAIHIDLRAAITQAIKEQGAVRSKLRRYNLGGEAVYLRISVKPLLLTEKSNELYLVAFESFDPDETFFIQSEAGEINDQTHPRIIELEQELAATKEHLQTYVEELETSNEELQALNEELQSTNEELQSTNEELETANEELQSTNEEMHIAYTELQTANQILERKDKELQRSEANIRALLNNTLQSFVLIDRNYSILAYNQIARKLIEEETGKKIFVGAPMIDFVGVDYLQTFLREFKESLSGHIVQGERSYIDTLSHVQWVRYNYTPIDNGFGEIQAVSCSALEITQHINTTDQVQNLERQLKFLETKYVKPLMRLRGKEGVVTFVNQSLCELLGYSVDELTGLGIGILLDTEGRAALASMIENVDTKTLTSTHDLHFKCKDGGMKAFSVQTVNSNLSSGSFLRDYLLLLELKQSE